MLGQDLSRIVDSTNPYFGFGFPPTTMVGEVLQRLAECRARAVVIVPDVRKAWLSATDRGDSPLDETSTAGRGVSVLSDGPP